MIYSGDLNKICYTNLPQNLVNCMTIQHSRLVESLIGWEEEEKRSLVGGGRKKVTP